MVRLLLQDVTLIPVDRLTLHIRFKSGAHRTIQLPLPQRSWEQRQTSSQMVAAIDRLLDNPTYPEVAAVLNSQSSQSGKVRVSP